MHPNFIMYVTYARTLALWGYGIMCVMGDFTRVPHISSPMYAERLRSALIAGTLGDALGYPLELLSATEIAERPQNIVTENTPLIFSDDTQLTCYTVDALTEVLEWNNQGAAADEAACLWLAYLRWYRGMGFVLPENAPYALPRTIDHGTYMTRKEGPGKATLRALASGEMQTATQNINPEGLGSGALVRSVAFGFLPVEQERTVVSLAVRGAALTHGHPEALVSAAAYALLVRDVLGRVTSDQPSRSSDILAASVKTIIEWCGTVNADSVFPGDGSQTRYVLEQALRLGSGEHPVEPSAETVAQEFGTDWMATTVLGLAVWVALYAESRARVSSGLARHILLDAYTQAISVDSDSDSIGSVMGSLVALCFQLGNLVEPQIKRVRGLDEVQAVAERFLAQLGL